MHRKQAKHEKQAQIIKDDEDEDNSRMIKDIF